MTQKGFATTSLLTLLPLLLSIAAFATGSFLILRENRRALFECRSGLLDAQEKLLNDMESLLKLNPVARNLKIQRKTAEAALIASAANPVALAAAQAALRFVIAQQNALDVAQRTLIQKANLSSRVRTRAVSKKVSDEVSSVHTASLAVSPTTRELAPEYKVAKEIEDKHTIRVSWIFRPLKSLPDWLNKILGQNPLKFTTECSTTSEKGSTRWQARLKRDKLSLN